LATPDHVVSIESEQEDATLRFPRLLYVGEFPPCNHHGGAILLKRLLDKHPADHLTVITSILGMKLSQTTDLFECRHIAFPALGRSQYLWLGMLMGAANWLILALVALRAVLVIRRQRVEALITIVQGRYYLAAALASWVTATPHIIFVHDNFVSGNAGSTVLVKKVLRRLTATILRRAAHIYVVSAEMQRLVSKECGMESEIQMPSTTGPARQAEGQVQVECLGSPVISFAGTISYAVVDCLDLLAKMIATGQLKEYGMPQAELHLCASMTVDEMRKRGWDHPGIIARGWVPQSELPGELSSADILLLPYSFLESSRGAVETAFPSKTADYLAAGKPILVFGPKYSTVVRYASEEGFAEIVDEFSPVALASSIQRIAFSRSYRETLATRALEVFSANHDIQCQQREFYLTLGRIIYASCRGA
jgi:glycosyltransferase involved in cell wall biosynthesis